MGFIDLLSKALGINQIEEQVTEEKNSENNELDGSIIVEIAKIKQEMITIEIYYPEKAEEIKQKIQELENFIEDSIEIDTDAVNKINSKYQEIKSEFEKLSKVSKEKVLINEVRLVYKELDNIFNGEENSEQKIDYNRINELDKKLQTLEGRKKDFEGIKQQNYIQELINAKYRLKCCKMLLNIDYYYEFSNSPEVEKIFYANIFNKDIMEMYRKIKRIKFNYKLQDMDISLDEQERNVDRIAEQMGNSYLEGKETISTDIFSDMTIIKLYIETMDFLRDKIVHLDKNIQQEKQDIEIKRMEEERAQREKEKREKERAEYKDLTEEQQKAKIEEIDNMYFDANKNCETIMEYELDVAKEKGLLSDRNQLKTKGSKLIQVSRENLFSLIEQLNKQNMQYGVFLDEDSKNCFLIISEELEFNKLVKDDSIGDDYKYIFYYIIDGKLTNTFITYLKNKINSQKGHFKIGNVFKGNQKGENITCISSQGNINIEDLKNVIYEIYKEVQNTETSEKDIEDIKFYLEIPYKRPICPILEKLKELGIEYYFLQNEPKTNKDRPIKKIYIDRKNLKKYKEKLHNEISTKEKGLIEIGLENIDIRDLILEGTDLPFIKEIEERKKQEEIEKQKEEEKKRQEEERKSKYAILSEQELRQQIKMIDNRSFDTTTSYKDILLFEREVAEAKGLLDEKSGMSSEDIDFMKIPRSKIYQYLSNARENSIRVSILPDADEDKKGTIIAIPKGKHLDGKIHVNTYPHEYLENKRFYKFADYKITKDFIKYIQNGIFDFDDYIRFSDDLYMYYSDDIYNEKTVRKEILSATQKLIDEKGKVNPPEVKSYIEMSYLRPMIPVLEELKKASIEYYIPPVLENTSKYNETKKIYMNLEDLERYKEKVHSQISSGQKGIVTIGDKGLNEADLILGETKRYIEKDLEEYEK